MAGEIFCSLSATNAMLLLGSQFILSLWFWTKCTFIEDVCCIGTGIVAIHLWPGLTNFLWLLLLCLMMNNWKSSKLLNSPINLANSPI